MQDKEFDHLFNSKLGDFEVEPSPMVWNNIADELHGKKGKRSIIPYLSIAASVIILASAGILFFNQTESTFVKPVKQDKVAVKTDRPDEAVKATETNITTRPVVITPANEVAAISTHTIKPKLIAGKPTQPITQANTPVVIDLISTNQPVIAAVVEPVQKQPAMVVPDKETSFAAAPVQVIETVTTVTASTETIKTPIKKRGIHSLGGLINAIVAKVDKREDKLIEFTEDEENGSTITGLNLGVVKIKKQ